MLGLCAGIDETRTGVAEWVLCGTVRHWLLIHVWCPHFTCTNASVSQVKGLYFVGASTRPGNGVPLAMISAKLTAEKILFG